MGDGSEVVEETVEVKSVMPDGVKPVPEAIKTSGEISDAELVLSVSQSPRETRMASSMPRETQVHKRCRISPDAESIELATSQDERSRTSSYCYDSEPVLTASQSLRQSAREARIG